MSYYNKLKNYYTRSKAPRREKEDSNSKKPKHKVKTTKPFFTIVGDVEQLEHGEEDYNAMELSEICPNLANYNSASTQVPYADSISDFKVNKAFKTKIEDNDIVFEK